eukprot:sb/3477312/
MITVPTATSVIESCLWIHGPDPYNIADLTADNWIGFLRIIRTISLPLNNIFFFELLYISIGHVSMSRLELNCSCFIFIRTTDTESRFSSLESTSDFQCLIALIGTRERE